MDKILRKYGFSENEVAVYVGLLKHVDITAFELAKEIKLARTSVYNILQRFEQQGLLTIWKKNNVKYYCVESPNKLVDILEEKKNEIESILPILTELTKNKEDAPIVRLYKGKDGMKTVWTDILETSKANNIRKIYAMSHPILFQSLPRFFPKWLEDRAKIGIYTDLIITNDAESRKTNLVCDQFRETRLLPSESPITGTIDIYGKKLAFFTIKKDEFYSVIIESEPIAETLRQFFISTWNLLGESSRFTDK